MSGYIELLMTDPKEAVSFIVSRDEAEGNIEVEGPVEPVIKCFVIPPN